MKEVTLIWHDFVEQNNKHLVKTWVDIQKGHRLLGTSIAFSHASMKIQTAHSIILVSVLLAIILFSLKIWLLPILITLFSCIILQVLKEEATNAIIRYALKSEVFYYKALNSRIIRVLAYQTV